MRRFALVFAVAASLTGTGRIFAQTPPASPPAKPPSPSDLPIAESVKTSLGDTVGLSTCFAKGDIITCKFVLTRNRPGNDDYNYEAKTWFGGSKLVDNFKEEHPVVDGYLLNGKNKHVKKINLETGESIVFSQDYGGEKADGVDQIRILFFGAINLRAFVLHGSVEASQ